MSDHITPASVTQPNSSILLPVGIVMIVLALFVPAQLDHIASGMPPGGGRFVAFLATDVFRLCFFIGIALSIIAVIRNRRSKQTSPPASASVNN